MRSTYEFSVDIVCRREAITGALMRTRGAYEFRLVQKGFVPVSLIRNEGNGVGYRSLKRVLWQT